MLHLVGSVAEQSLYFILIQKQDRNQNNIHVYSLILLYRLILNVCRIQQPLFIFNLYLMLTI